MDGTSDGPHAEPHGYIDLYVPGENIAGGNNYLPRYLGKLEPLIYYLLNVKATEEVDSDESPWFRT